MSVLNAAWLIRVLTLDSCYCHVVTFLILIVLGDSLFEANSASHAEKGDVVLSVFCV